MQQVDGVYSRYCCKKLFFLAGNSCAVGARKTAKNNAIASVAWLHSVYVMASVLKINMSINRIKYVAILVLLLSYLKQIFQN